MGGALFLLRLARNLCRASAAVGLRRRPLSMKGSEMRLSSSSGTWNTDCRFFMDGGWVLPRSHDPQLLSHRNAHVWAANLRLGGRTSGGLRCRAPIWSGPWQSCSHAGVCHRDAYGRWICCSADLRFTVCSWCISIHLCDGVTENTPSEWASKLVSVLLS